MRCPVPSCASPSSRFGVRAALGGAMHTGLDFPVPINTSVMAADRGVVRSVWWNAGGGRMVAITHSDRLETRYAHLTRATVKAGDVVAAGQQIALSGATGALVTGPVLHFEVIVDGSPVDPAPYLSGAAGNATPDRITCNASSPPAGYVRDPSGPNRCIRIGAPGTAELDPLAFVGDRIADVGGALVPVLANVALLGAAALIAWGGVRRVLDG